MSVAQPIIDNYDAAAVGVAGSGRRGTDGTLQPHSERVTSNRNHSSISSRNTAATRSTAA